jgi:peptidoglycan hydrolase CwlO-like protein
MNDEIDKLEGKIVNDIITLEEKIVNDVMKTEERIATLEKVLLEENERLKSKIKGLERQLNEMYVELERTHITSASMREVMEEVAKLANQPVGMMFNNYGS